MTTDRRKLWAIILFIGIFVPFLAVFMISLLSPAKGALDFSTASSGAGLVSRPRAAGSPSNHAGAPLLVAGDGHTVWVAHPFVTEGTAAKAFEMLMRTSNSGRWSAVEQDNVSSVWRGFPQAMALQLTSSPAQGNAVPVVFSADGYVNAFSLTEQAAREGLPSGHEVRAAASSAEGIFALTLGPPVASATRPGDGINSESSLPPPTLPALGITAGEGNPSTSMPASPATTAASSAPSATAPSTKASVETPGPSYNLYRMQQGRWTFLPALGLPGSADVPGSTVPLALTTAGSRLLVLWVDPAHPAELLVRTLDVNHPENGWTAAVRSPLGDTMPAHSRLLTATINHAVYVFWTVGVPDATAASQPSMASVELHGGLLNTVAGSVGDLTLPAKTIWAPLVLGPATAGIEPENDIGIGAAENSLVVVMNARDGALSSALFDLHGAPLAAAATVEIAHAHHDTLPQNFGLLMMAFIFALAFWQWRQKPATATLPPGFIAAPIHLRAVAFIIDAAIPYAAVVLIFGQWESGAFSLLSSWIAEYATPEQLFGSVELLSFLGLYLLHVTLGELFFRRSVGKALVGIQVLMIDGKSPTVAAVLVRNLVRIPEMIAGVVVLYIFIADSHRRLGDLLARTVVVAAETPKTPEDPDKESRK